MGARAARRRARPPEDEGGLPRVRADGAAARASASSATSRSARRHARRADAALRRRRLRRRRADRPPARHPGRGPARLLGRHRVRRLVQRPPGLPGPGVRPLARARGRDRQRQRRARRRADARADPEELAPTDTTDAAIEAINAAGVREIVVVGRRGPVQAAWTPVEVGELGELAGADILVDPAELELDDASAAELEAAPPTVKRNVEHLRDYASREPAGQAARDPTPLPPLAGRDPRRGPRRGDRARPQRARRRARRRDRGSRDDRVRHRLPQRRLPRRRASGRPVRRAHGDGPQRGGACSGRTPRQRVLRRLDQARPERRDRHEQEGRDRDGRALLEDARAGGSSGALDGPATSRTCSPSARRRRALRGLGGDRPARERRRRAARRPRVKLATWDELLAARARPSVEGRRDR